MKIVIAGGTGFLGRPLTERLLRDSNTVVVLSRTPSKTQFARNVNIVLEEWDGRNVGSWQKHIEGSDAVVNLAGDSIGGSRWTSSQKRRILDSRVNATRALVDAIAGARRKPRVLVNASAVGYYGNVESGEVTEEYAKGKDFLAGVVDRWEAEARRAENHGVRAVMLRCGIVLARDGGALKRFLLPFNLFVGGPLGSGRQWLPWVHRDDAIAAYLFAIQNSGLSGPVNVAAPESATMKQFCSALGRAMRRPSWATVPAFALRIALGEMATIVLTGQNVVPTRLVGAGFTFQYPRLAEAFGAIFSRERS
jgi:uncharacterized protein (TIGR01777 family)